MQNLSLNFVRFSQNYIQPIIDDPATQMEFKLAIEVVKIVAATVFLEYLTKRFLSHPSQVSSSEIYATVISAPFQEEIFFRLIVLKGIHLVQEVLNRLEEREESVVRIRLASHFFANRTSQDPDRFEIAIYPPITEELLARGFVRGIYLMSKIPQFILSRLYLASGIFPEESIKSDTFKIPISLPLEQELIFYAVKKGISWIKIPSNDIEEELTEEQEKKQLEQIFRIHLAALIFAAAHLSNHHPNKTSAVIQFVWTYLGGLAYGYMSEKYQSLAPGIMIHGINNFLAMAGKVYPELAPLCLLALLINRLASYILAVTTIDKIVFCDIQEKSLHAEQVSETSDTEDILETLIEAAK